MRSNLAVASERLLAIIVIGLSCGEPARASDWETEQARIQARRALVNVDLAEKKWKQVVSTRIPPQLAPTARSAFQEVLHKSQRVLNETQAVKRYLQRIASGDVSDETYRLLMEYRHREQMAENEVEEAAAKLEAAVQSQ
jgi:hypothetical protein